MHQPAPPVDRHVLEPGTADRFARDGWVLVPGVLPGDALPDARRAVAAAAGRATEGALPLAERDTYGRAFLQAMNLWRSDPAVARVVLAERFAGVAATLLGVAAVRLYHDQALFKEAGGGPTPWHQDAFYWPFDPAPELVSVTMWLPLVDVAEGMGGMEFARGSHLEGPVADVGISDESERRFAAMVDAGRWPVDAPGPMRAGDATFHAGWTVHRAAPNTTSTVREVLTVIYLADGIRVARPANRYQEHDAAEWLPGAAPGDLVGGDLHPLLGAGGPAAPGS